MLYDRLEARQYSQKKISENVECEIMQVVLEEARSSFPEECVHEVRSDTVEEMESNVARVAAWLDAWRQNNGGGGGGGSGDGGGRSSTS